MPSLAEIAAYTSSFNWQQVAAMSGRKLAKIAANTSLHWQDLGNQSYQRGQNVNQKRLDGVKYLAAVSHVHIYRYEGIYIHARVFIFIFILYFIDAAN